MTYMIAVVVTPYFNAMATCAFLDPFRAANYLSNESLYHWDFYSSPGGSIPASNGMAIETLSLQEMNETGPDMGVVSSSWTPEKYYEDRTLIANVRKWGRSGVTLCGLDTGSFILAHAGQAKDRAATVHYEHIDALQEVHPDVQTSEQLFVMDGDLLSTGGGVASIDLALQLIRNHHGDALANASARYIFHERLRRRDERQNSAGYEPIGQTTPEKLREAILLMEQNLEEPLAVPEIARRVDLSQRHLVRLFKRYTKHSVVQYYRDIRLDRGRALVTQTDMSVLEIAVACGFGSVGHFSRAYRGRFGITPREDRVAGRVPFEFRAWPMHPKG